MVELEMEDIMSHQILENTVAETTDAFTPELTLDSEWTIGKHRGKRIKDVLLDKNYMIWLNHPNQSWFRPTYPALAKFVPHIEVEDDAVDEVETIVDTPVLTSTTHDYAERNEMQMLFLNEDFCDAVSFTLPNVRAKRTLDKERLTHFSELAHALPNSVQFIDHMQSSEYRFEHEGWDVFFQPKQFIIEMNANMKTNSVRAIAQSLSINGLFKKHDGKVVANSFYSGSRTRYDSLAIVLKPELDDSYSTVLKAIKARREVLAKGEQAKTAIVLFVRRATFARVTIDQVKSLFAKENVILMLESEVNANIREYHRAVVEHEFEVEKVKKLV